MEKLMSLGNEKIKFSGLGEIYSYTIMYQSSEQFQQFLPYAVALVKLEEGPLVTAMLTDVDLSDIYIGMQVEMVTRLLSEEGERGIRHYGYKFRPRDII